MISSEFATVHDYLDGFANYLAIARPGTDEHVAGWRALATGTALCLRAETGGAVPAAVMNWLMSARRPLGSELIEVSQGDWDSYLYPLLEEQPDDKDEVLLALQGLARTLI